MLRFYGAVVGFVQEDREHNVAAEPCKLEKSNRKKQKSKIFLTV